MGRPRKHIQPETSRWYESFDWSVDPQTSKEILSLLTLALGALFLLAIFGGAGQFGRQTLRILNSLFGLAAFLAPFALLATGVTLWKVREVKIKGPSLLGLILLFIFIPSLFGIFKAGGAIGDSGALFFTDLFGLAAGFLIILALAIASSLLATNLSLTRLKYWFMGGQPMVTDETDQEQQQEARVSVFQTVKNKLSSRPSAHNSAPVQQMPIPPAHVPVQAPKSQIINWSFPPLDLLSYSTTKATSGNITKNIEIIQKTFKDFGIGVSMGDVHIGPTVTQYTFKPSDGVKVTALTARSDDLALSLAAHPIRIEAPIPGKSVVGIEIPNKTPAIVTLREVLESQEFKDAKNTLGIPFGRDVAGTPFVADLAKMPHLLIAGSTGSGKSVAINGLIVALLFQHSPATLRMILIDPKRVEFTQYSGIPHLLTSVVTEPDKTVNTLKWVVAEMERRYKVFAEIHKRNITEYNASPGETGHMPYIVVVIDELADLMMQAANDVEAAIVRLSQLARATGIHLVVATQRPSVDVITGLIKANIATRVAFAVASQIDSRTILDQSGAEKLLGHGDMLFLGNEIGKPKRVQGVLVSDKEIKSLTDFLKRDGIATYDDSIQDYRVAGAAGTRGGAEGPMDDDMFEQAKETVVSSGNASASFLQRRLRVGYARAARLLDLLQDDGVIGPPNGSKARDVLMSPDMLRSQANSAPTGNFGQPAQPKQYTSSQPYYANVETKSPNDPIDVTVDDEDGQL